MKDIIKRYNLEIFFSISFLLIGMSIGYVSNNNSYYWYDNLDKPFFTPPNYVFPVVWTIIYLMLGVVFAKIWKIRKNRDNKFLLSIFLVQLIINLTWSPLFFYAHRIDLALCNILLLWSVLVYLLYLLRKEYFLFVLCIPYFMWVSLALIMNYYIYILN